MCSILPFIGIEIISVLSIHLMNMLFITNFEGTAVPGYEYETCRTNLHACFSLSPFETAKNSLEIKLA